MIGKATMVAIALASLVTSAVLVTACDDSSSNGNGAGASSGLPGDPDGGGGSEAGAGDGAPLGPGEVPPPGSATSFCDGTLGVVARALEACCTPADQTTQNYKVTHGFVAGLTPVCTKVLDASISKGRVAFHPADASACYAAYASTYAPGKCANITTTFYSPAGASCSQTFTGIVAEGGACGGDHECQDGLTCVGYTQGTNAADGVCHAPGSIGAPCGAAKNDGGTLADITTLEFGTHPACAAGARCNSATGKCEAAQTSGMSCVKDGDCASPLLCHLLACGTTGPASTGGECKSKSDCMPGLYCERPTNANGTCQPKKAAGGTCTGSSFETACIGRCDAANGAMGSCVTFCGSP